MSSMRSRMSSFNARVSSVYSCNTSTCFGNSFESSSLTDWIIWTSVVDSPNESNPRSKPSFVTKSFVYVSSISSNSGRFRPVKMLFQIFSLVSTFSARWSLNSPETSCCLWRNKPCSLKPPKYTGSIGSNINFNAIQFVKYPTIVPPIVKVQGLS